MLLSLFLSFYFGNQKHRASFNKIEALSVGLSSNAIYLWVNYLRTKYRANNFETLQLEKSR